MKRGTRNVERGAKEHSTAKKADFFVLFVPFVVSNNRNAEVNETPHAKNAKGAKKAWKKGLSLGILALPVRVWSQADLERAIATGRGKMPRDMQTWQTSCARYSERGARKAELRTTNKPTENSILCQADEWHCMLKAES